MFRILLTLLVLTTPAMAQKAEPPAAAAIQDWSLDGLDGRHGNYTTRVIAAQPGNEYLLQILSPQPLPAHW